MPARYWLVGREQVAAVSRLEAAGGVRAAEAAVDAGELAAAHARYAAERDREVPPDAVHRPTGGVGGTREGVSASTPTTPGTWRVDPIRSVAGSPPSWSTLRVEITATIVVHHGGAATTLPTTIGELLAELEDSDPPSRNRSPTIGAITDDVDNLLRQHPDVAERRSFELVGDEAWHLAVVRARASARRRDDEDPGRPRRPRGPVPNAGDGRRATGCTTRRCNQIASTRSWRRAARCWRSCAGSHLSTAVAVHGAGALMRHPSGRPQIPSPLRLYGNRVMLRPLVAHDFGAGATCAAATRHG